MKNKVNERAINYDFMRVLMSLFVICLHAGVAGRISNNRVLTNLFQIFLIQCNGVFYMMSGKFNLCKKFECKKDYINYYINKFIFIIVPYGIVSCLLVLYEMIMSEQPWNLNGYIYQCYGAFFSTNAGTHLWFVCTLIGMLASTPFLAKMVSAMKNEELKILFGVGIIWNIFAIYLTGDIGMWFGFGGWFLWGWIFIYFSGYFCDRIVCDKNVKIFYSLGIIGFIITVLGMSYLETYVYATDLSVGFIFFVMGCYLFMQRHIKINNATLKRIFCPIITYMSRYTFVAYMLHIIVLHGMESKFEGIIPIVLLTFIISYLASILISNILIKPIQVILLKVIAVVSANNKEHSMQG